MTQGPAFTNDDLLLIRTWNLPLGIDKDSDVYSKLIFSMRRQHQQQLLDRWAEKQREIARELSR